jgi:hypothetical protein
MLGNHWLPLACTCAALALWALAAANAYAWEMLWLPAAVAGAACSHDHSPTREHWLRQQRTETPDRSRQEPGQTIILSRTEFRGDL